MFNGQVNRQGIDHESIKPNPTFHPKKEKKFTYKLVNFKIKKIDKKDVAAVCNYGS